MYSLHIMSADGQTRTVPIDRDLMILGRTADCDIVLNDTKVSSRHARIVREGGGLFLEDLGSTNGTWVANEEKASRYRLDDDDLIQLGTTRIHVCLDSTIIQSSTALFGPEAETSFEVNTKVKLRALLEIASVISGTVHLDKVLERILEALFTVLPQAEHGHIFLGSGDPDDLRLRASRTRVPDSLPVSFSRTIFRKVMSENQAVLCKDLRNDPRFDSALSVQGLPCSTMICVPLCDQHRRPMGVIQVDSTNRLGSFDKGDLKLLAAVAGPVGLVIENARLYELDRERTEMEKEGRDARAVQLALVPARPPSVPGYQFWHFYEPARLVGGDYFDYRPLTGPPSEDGSSRDRWAVSIGDVAGKGMPAALMMARLSSEVALMLQIEPDPARAVARLNQSLCAACVNERLITFLLVVLDAARHELTFVGAGHPPPLIRRVDGVVDEVPVGPGMLLGVEPAADYEATRAALAPGEILILYSDGITDAGEGSRDRFEIDRLRQVLAGAPPTAEAAGRAIVEAVRRHVDGHPAFDDMTLLCISRD